MLRPVDSLSSAEAGRALAAIEVAQSLRKSRDLMGVMQAREVESVIEEREDARLEAEFQALMQVFPRNSLKDWIMFLLSYYTSIVPAPSNPCYGAQAGSLESSRGPLGLCCQTSVRHIAH